MAKVKTGLFDTWRNADIIETEKIMQVEIISEPEFKEGQGDYSDSYTARVRIGKKEYQVRMNKTTIKNLVGNNPDFDLKDLVGVTAGVTVEHMKVPGKEEKQKVIFFWRIDSKGEEVK